MTDLPELNESFAERLSRASPWDAWLAALIDGEGSICIYDATGKENNPPDLTFRVAIASTDRILLEVAQVISGGVGTLCDHRAATRTWRRTWVWYVPSQRAMGLLRRILPLLVIKQVQAEIALAFGRTLQPRKKLSSELQNFRRHLQSLMRRTNKRGPGRLEPSAARHELSQLVNQYDR